MPESTVEPEGTERGLPLGSNGSSSRPAATSSQAGSGGVLAPHDFEAELEDAENLLRYAAEAGIELDEPLRTRVLALRAAGTQGWSQESAGELLACLTRLSALLKPVSADSLRKCVDAKEVATLRTYRWVAIALAIIIVPFSVAAFVAAATCEAIRKDLEVENGLALVLLREFSLTPGPTPPPGASPDQPTGDPLKDLQQFAATNRAIYARARTLRFFAAYAVGDAVAGDLELVPDAPLREQADKQVRLFQTVRQFAHSVQEAVSTTFGAFTSCVLPMLYALLGACAYLIRSFEAQLRAHTFTGTDKTTARFLIALIGGLVVGLFGNFGTGHGVTLSPLAIAFLVGYGVDVFFYFLDGLLRTFANPRGEEPAPAK